MKKFYDKQIAILCDVELPNYLDVPNRYNYLEGNHSATGYYYWILKNFGIKNIHLVGIKDNLSCYDAVLFHYDNKDFIDTTKKYKTFQIVTDRPQLPGVDLYGCCNLSSFKTIKNTRLIQSVGLGLKGHLFGNKIYVPYPMALNVKKCGASWPPKIYHYTGRESTLIKGIASKKFADHMKQKGVNLRFDFVNDHNKGDEDVYFCVRNRTNYYSRSSGGNNVDSKYGQKTANRLYQSWKMGTPFITSGSSAMAAIYETEYDFLIADNLEEFEYQCLKLLNNQDVFEQMKSVCNKRKNEHTNYLIVKQLLLAFERLFA